MVNKRFLNIHLNKRGRDIRVVEDNESSIVIEIATDRELECHSAIARDLHSMGLSDADCDSWAERFSYRILLRGLVETMFEE